MNIEIRAYKVEDFEAIHRLNRQEEWNNLVAKKEDTKNAWEQSNVAFVACFDNQVIGYIRGMTDGFITLYVCELVIDSDFRGNGIGTNLLKYAHDQYPKTRVELLASSTSHSYYESQKFRSFSGFRKTYIEWQN